MSAQDVELIGRMLRADGYEEADAALAAVGLSE
jgi:hypothetical protein